MNNQVDVILYKDNFASTFKKLFREMLGNKLIISDLISLIVSVI